MAYSSYFRSVLNDNFKILTWVLIVFIAITPNFIFMRSANAANVGGWSIGGLVADGASAIVNGSKQVIIDGKNYLKKGTAKITPTASQVSKVLARGAAGYALSVAVEQLLGAVDWVLDPENNQIIYKEITDPNQPPNSEYYYTINTTIGPKRIFGKTKEELCSNVEIALNALNNGLNYAGKGITGDTSGTCWYNVTSSSTGEVINPWGGVPYERILNPAYDPSKEEEEKFLPLDVVSQQVISNAEAGDPNAQVATTAAAQDIINDAQQDETKARPIVQQLEASASTENADSSAQEAANEATGQSQPNTANPQATDIKLNFPVFCGWAPLVCQAAQTVISFPQMLTNWWDTANQKANEWATAISEAWTYAKNWATENHTDSESTKVTVEQDNNIIFDDSQRITFGNSCPTPQQFSVSFFGTTQNLEFSYDPLCQFMSMIKPFVVAGSYLIGAYIVMGLSRGSAE